MKATFILVECHFSWSFGWVINVEILQKEPYNQVRSSHSLDHGIDNSNVMSVYVDRDCSMQMMFLQGKMAWKACSKRLCLKLHQCNRGVER